MLHTDQSLRDLQGGVYRDGVVLLDPVILSRDRQYGVTALGAATHSNVTWQPVPWPKSLIAGASLCM